MRRLHSKVRKKNYPFQSTGIILSLLINVPFVMANPAPLYESRNDHYRTGANLNETILNTANVSYSDFGLLFSLPVDSSITTQTLYAPGVSVKNVLHNVVYITTTGGSVYAFDADQSGPPLWVDHFNAAAPGVHWSIDSTPIIDPASQTLYVVARTVSNTNRQFELHALNLSTGAEKFNGPVVLSGTYGANGYTLDFSNPAVSQNLKSHAGLALVNGQLIICFSSLSEGVGDYYSGWVLSYNASTLQPTAAFATIISPPATGGGIWQAGRAPVVDDNGFIYLFVGNAYLPNTYAAAPNGYDGVSNFSESLLKLDANLNLVDWFTPGGWVNLDNRDLDLSSSGPTLIEGTGLLTGAGKDGNLYVWNTNSLGHYNATDAQVVQKMPGPNNYKYVYNGVVFWRRSSEQGGSLLFNVYNNSPIYSFAFNNPKFNPTPVSSSSASKALNSGIRNSVALSANGGNAGTGIVWELQNNSTTNVSVLRALDATNLGNELWNSSTYLSDSLAGANTYIPPTISNGKVYAPTLNSQLVVYGLKSQPLTISSVANQNSALKSNVSLQINASAGGDTLVYAATGLPSGLSINPTTGVISGTPSVIGAYSTVVTVTDRNTNKQATTSFSWTISRGIIKS